MGYFHLIVRRFGVNDSLRDAILDATGIDADDLDDPNTEINFAQQYKLFDNMNRLFGEGWALEAPEIWRPAAHGALGVAVISAPTVGAGLEILAKYMSVRTPMQRIRLAREGDAIVARHQVITTLPDAQNRFAAEAVLLGISATLGVILGAAHADLTFEFSMSRPAYGQRLEEALVGHVRWNAASNAVVVPRRLLALRSPLADGVMHRAAIESLEQTARQATAPEGVKGRVERLLARSDTGRLPSELAARALGLSQRTLVRRLGDVGLSYRDLVDEELKARAKRWLDGGTLSRAEISERLGFADATGFSRACRRWFKAAG